MFIRKKKNKSGSTSIVIVSKLRGVYKEMQTIGIGNSETEVASLILQGKEWIKAELYLYGEERTACEQDVLKMEEFLSHIDNIPVNDDDLILNRVFDRIGFNQVEDIVFLSRFCFFGCKAW